MTLDASSSRSPSSPASRGRCLSPSTGTSSTCGQTRARWRPRRPRRSARDGAGDGAEPVVPPAPGDDRRRQRTRGHAGLNLRTLSASRASTRRILTSPRRWPTRSAAVAGSRKPRRLYRRIAAGARRPGREPAVMRTGRPVIVWITILGGLRGRTTRGGCPGRPVEGRETLVGLARVQRRPRRPGRSSLVLPRSRPAAAGRAAPCSSSSSGRPRTPEPPMPRRSPGAC